MHFCYYYKSFFPHIKSALFCLVLYFSLFINLDSPKKKEKEKHQQQHFAAMVRRAVSMLGLHSKVSHHNFRIGAATLPSLCGCPPITSRIGVMKIGRLCAYIRPHILSHFL